MIVQGPPKRPPSVWLSQIALLIVSIPFDFLLFSVIWRAWSHPEQVSHDRYVLFWILIFLVPIVAGFVGLAMRRQWGRWISSIFFLAVSALCLMALLVTVVSSPLFIFSAFSLYGLVLIGGFGFLAFQLILGTKAAEFFAYYN